MKNYTITVNGKVYEVTVEEGFHGKGGETATVPVNPPKTSEGTPKPVQPAATAGGLQVKAPMPGKILEMKASVGQPVKRGDVLMILEAMKMENEIVAPEDGTVALIQVSAGMSVEAGDILAALNV